MKKYPTKLMVGWRETVSLPSLHIPHFSAKVDTGARTTALHATDIWTYQVKGETWVEFIPDHSLLKDQTECALPVHHRRAIKNTSGIPQERIIVVTDLRVGDRVERVEIALSDRSDMKFPLIIGRTALRVLGLTVDPARSWLNSPKLNP